MLYPDMSFEYKYSPPPLHQSLFFSLSAFYFVIQHFKFASITKLLFNFPFFQAVPGPFS